ncbi:hypothetical protein E2C01_020048 [Portunus trituberculatus]|uniref:Uncharacterized protein n=1 Tax=Portunus trituberculatus TaxID=210409 RepID=A0A5B7E0P2_PORTR|nr:hypothetical protein [Portunus trituberculatus]
MPARGILSRDRHEEDETSDPMFRQVFFPPSQHRPCGRELTASAPAKAGETRAGHFLPSLERSSSFVNTHRGHVLLLLLHWEQI